VQSFDVSGSAAALRGGRRLPLSGSRTMRIVRRGGGLLVAGISVTVFVACLAIAGLNYAGYRSAPMLSASMRKVMPVGSLVIVKPVRATSVHVGEVVMFRAPGYNGDYTHRIHAITKTSNGLAFTTKGDENPEVDPWRLRSVNGRGRFGKLVADIPYAGYAVEYSRDWRIRLLMLALACAAGLALALRRIWNRREP
jgi:signal peptidase I